MKKRIILSSLTALVLAVLTFATTAFAWGPERTTFTWEKPATYVTFNSMTNHPTLGDERDFVRIREVGASKFVNEVTLTPGKEYEVYVYYHNNASESYNESGVGIARDTRVSSYLPEAVKAGGKLAVTGKVSASNASPATVWDEAYISANTDVLIRYVPGSAILTNGGKMNGTAIAGSALFSDEGHLVGFNSITGALPGCNKYAGNITYRFKVDQPAFTIAKEVSIDGGNTWSERARVKVGDKVEFRIVYKNTGTTEQKDVIVKDKFPAGLVLISGMTKMNTSANTNYVSIDDNNLFSAGLNIGDYRGDSYASVRYQAQINNDGNWKCGSNKIYNLATVSTTNGAMTDKVELDVIKECEVTELPQTGPMEIILVVFAVGAMTVGGVYWWRSRKMLHEMQAVAEGVKVDGGDVDSGDTSNTVTVDGKNESLAEKTVEKEQKN